MRKKDRNMLLTFNAMHLHPYSSLCCITAQTELGMKVRCVGGHTLVYVLFMAVLITPFLVKRFSSFP